MQVIDSIEAMRRACASVQRPLGLAREYNDAFYAQVQRGPGRGTSTATYQGSETPKERLERES